MTARSDAHRRGNRSAALAVAGALLMCPTPAVAEAPELVGAVRLLGASLHYPEVPGLFDSDHGEIWAGIGRLLVDWQATPDLAIDANLFLEMSRLDPGAAGGAFTTAGSLASPYRSSALSLDLRDGHAASGELGVDCLSLHLLTDALDLRLGRFPVNYSVTGIFTPNDVFAPFSSTTVNRVYKPGVDGVQLGFPLGDMSGLELTAVIGNDGGDHPSWAQSALLIRVSTVGAGFEWAALGGKLAERWLVGGSFQGEAGGLGWRGEGHLNLPDSNGDGTLDDIDGDGHRGDDVAFRLAAGVDRSFPWRNASFSAEVAYLSDGASAPEGYAGRARRLLPDDIPFLGRTYLGVSAGGEVMPILRASALALVNLNDGSGEGVLSLVLSAADESEIVGGLIVPWGDTPARFDTASPRLDSELGHLPVTAFVEARLYF